MIRRINKTTISAKPDPYPPLFSQLTIITSHFYIVWGSSDKGCIIDPSTMKLELDIMEIAGTCVLVVYDGKVKVRELPMHGEYKIVRK